MAFTRSTLVLSPGEGHSISLGPARFIFKVTRDDTEGAYALMEYLAPPGAGAPFHRHYREDETFHILDGTMTFQLEEKTFEASPGCTVLIPRGQRHAFVNCGDATVRALIMVSPAGLEQYFQELATLTETETLTEKRLLELNQRYALEF